MSLQSFRPYFVDLFLFSASNPDPTFQKILDSEKGRVKKEKSLTLGIVYEQGCGMWYFSLRHSEVAKLMKYSVKFDNFKIYFSKW
jgi:hypothetical protein